MTDVTATYVGCPITSASVKSGAGLKYGVYSATKAGAKDWVIFGDFTTIYFCGATSAVVAQASAESCNITSNYVYLSGAATGVQYYLVVGV